ncbi:uncharacterized protein LOC126853396 [Cataglyphis hispanica]|uniref:uncharacterized protein LOC126853396 n=1 Tax=Cataglyphis hispanica TaxID=1086592 RepID=UPI00217FF115|nr:uncharacterized protein LOC126853396 [Cataglyphis hispanica]
MTFVVRYRYQPQIVLHGESCMPSRQSSDSCLNIHCRHWRLTYWRTGAESRSNSRRQSAAVGLVPRPETTDAVQQWNPADPVELFLGADVGAVILQIGLRRGGRWQPVAQRTLGWILSGSVDTSAATRSAQSHQCCSDDDLHSLVQEFWRQEEVDAKTVPLTTDEQEVKDHFVRTHSRDASGRFVVRLPLRLPLPDLTGIKRTAVRLLGQMERRLARDDQLKQLYTDFMREYEVLRHMSPARPAGAAGPADCYLPHAHGVMRKASSAKIRVVFNGSSTVPSVASLNRHFKAGPNLLPVLENVLLRWRIHRYVLASDIEKMYRQILVAPEDRHLQRILWRSKDQTTPQTFELNTVTYGLACALFLAVRSLR